MPFNFILSLDGKVKFLNPQLGVVLLIYVQMYRQSTACKAMFLAPFTYVYCQISAFCGNCIVIQWMLPYWYTKGRLGV